jgi:hypothetical protein
MIAENADQLLDIGEMRHVFERQRIVGQQGGDHQRQRCVLGAGDGNDAVELVAADDFDAIHEPLRRVARRLLTSKAACAPDAPRAERAGGTDKLCEYQDGSLADGVDRGTLAAFPVLGRLFRTVATGLRGWQAYPEIGLAGAPGTPLRLAELEVAPQLGREAFAAPRGSIIRLFLVMCRHARPVASRNSNGGNDI